MKFNARFVLLLIAGLLAAARVEAAPPVCNGGSEGTIVYNKDHKQVQFCNGTDWINTSGNFNADTLAGLSCSSGQIAKWNGTAWGCAADSGGLPALTSANLWVGNGSNVATAVAMSGDATLSNAGVLTIANNAVGTAEITNASIALADLSATGTPSAATFLRGDNSWAAPGYVSPVVYNAGSATSINWGNGTQQYTTASCGALTFSNMLDGGVYTLAVQGATSGTCSFTHAGLTFRLPPGHGATTAATHTVYSFARMGTVVYVSWLKGI